MATNTNNKFYWLKLRHDFFKRQDMMVLESMPEGKDYVLFYLKLLTLGIESNGKLRFSETVPYNSQILSTITNTSSQIVEHGLNVFQQFDLIQITDDDTIIVNNLANMLGACSNDEAYRESNRERQQRYRERQKELNSHESRDNDVTVTLSKIDTVNAVADICNVNHNGEIDTDKDIESDTDIDIDQETENNSVSVSVKKVSKKKHTFDLFEKWWSVYPKKIDKAGAKRAWLRINPSDALFSEMLDKLNQQRLSSQWQKNSGQFIPYPTTYLHQSRWEENVTLPQTSLETMSDHDDDLIVF